MQNRFDLLVAEVMPIDGVLEYGVLTMSSPDQLDWAEDPYGRILMGQFRQPLPHTRKTPQDLALKTRTLLNPRPLVSYIKRGHASQ